MNFLREVKKYKHIEIKKLEAKQSENPFAKLFYPGRKSISRSNQNWQGQMECTGIV